MITAAHPKIRYVATATICLPLDLMNKVIKALNAGGPSLIHVLTPCPKGWFYNPHETYILAKLALDSGMWVLWENSEGKFKLNYKPNPRKHVKEYLRRQGRFVHLIDAELDMIDKMVEEEWKLWLESDRIGKIILT